MGVFFQKFQWLVLKSVYLLSCWWLVSHQWSDIIAGAFTVDKVMVCKRGAVFFLKVIACLKKNKQKSYLVKPAAYAIPDKWTNR